jgi:hypothetical protein
MKNLLLLLIFLIILSSCSKEPKIEFDKAVKVFNEAKKYNANIYYFEEFNSLQDSMNDVTLKISEKNLKIFKTFSSERKKLNYIITKSNELIDNSKYYNNIVLPNDLSKMTDAQFVAWKYSNITPEEIKKMTVAEFNEWKEAMKYINK